MAWCKERSEFAPEIQLWLSIKTNGDKKMISPHGSKELKVLLLEDREKEAELKRAEALP